jgi:uncharacterized membrane protein (UPF0182 family)
MEETLEAGLARLFGGGRQLLAQRDASAPVAAPAPAADAADGEAARRAVAHYERARAAQRSDDWATYGEEMRLLGEALRQLNARSTQRP